MDPNFTRFQLVPIEQRRSDPSPIYQLIRDGAGVDRVSALLEQNPELLRSRGEGEVTLLHEAARFGSLELVRFLVSKGADINAACYNNYTPLRFAAEGGKLEMVKYFVQQGASLRFDDFRSSPLRDAAFANHRDVVDFLVSAGVPWDLHAAVWLGDEVEVRKILEKTPGSARMPYILHTACRKGNLAIVDRLLQCGADPNDLRFQLRRICPPLCEAREFPEIVKLLLKNGADSSIPCPNHGR